MRTVKIIIGFISAVSIIFFATGLFVKETNYTAQVSINKTVEEVFTTFNQQEKIKNWIPEIQSVEVLNTTIGTTGSSYKMVVENQGQEIVMTQKVMAYVPDEKVTFFIDAENMLKTNDYIFEEKNRITTITLNASCQSESYLMACMFPYFKGTFKAQDQLYLDNFKAYLEKQ